MSLSKRRRTNLDLEKDWVLTKEDFRAIGKPKFHEPKDLNSYLDFLDLHFYPHRCFSLRPLNGKIESNS